jgi:hypothetical protein
MAVCSKFFDNYLLVPVAFCVFFMNTSAGSILSITDVK